MSDDSPKPFSLYEAPPAAAPQSPAPALVPKAAAAKPSRVAKVTNPDDRCDRCHANRKTQAVFVVIQHSPHEESKHGFFGTATLTTSRVDTHCFQLCAACGARSDELNRRARRLTPVAIAGLAASVLAVPAFLLKLPPILGVLLFFGGGLVAAAAMFGAWLVNHQHVEYLPVEYQRKRSISMYTRDVTELVTYLQKASVMSAEAAEEYRRHF